MPFGQDVLPHRIALPFTDADTKEPHVLCAAKHGWVWLRALLVKDRRRYLQALETCRQEDIWPEVGVNKPERLTP